MQSNILGLKNEHRVALFIDGANLYNTTKSCGFDIDYKKLLDLFSSEANLIRAFYYTALMEDSEYSSIRPLIDWLDYNGYAVVTKPTKEFTDAMGRRKVKGNMDIELAIDALELTPHIDHAFIFSGDGDFRSLVEAVQRKGVRVTVVSALDGGEVRQPMIADELRRQADRFINLNQDRKGNYNEFTKAIRREDDQQRDGIQDGLARTLAPRPAVAAGAAVTPRTATRAPRTY
jgi:uncharacterized LabA/DUF88 family protein